MCPLGMAISVDRDGQGVKIEIASQARIFMSSRAQRGDLAFRVLANRKVRLLRRLTFLCPREERGDLS